MRSLTGSVDTRSEWSSKSKGKPSGGGPEGMENTRLWNTGEIELHDCDVEVLAKIRYTTFSD